MHIPICLAADTNYVQHLAVTMASVLKNKEQESIVFYILETGFTEKEKNSLEKLKSISPFEIQYINVENSVLKACPQNLFKHDRMSIATYFRLFIPSIIPNEDRLIYLDCDLIVRTSLKNLFNLDFRDNYVLGVRDIDSRSNAGRLGTKRYINAGVMLMNLKKMREDGIQQKFVSFILNEGHRILWHDQDVIAATLDGFIGYIDGRWNGQIARLPKKFKYSRLHDSFILHYVGDRKPWLPMKDAKFIEEYFKHLRLTPFSEYEKEYRSKRLLYFALRSLAFIPNCIISKVTSPKRTYNTFYVFGIPFKRKRKSRRK